MISEISVKDTASYDEEGVTFDNLGKVNFVYGSNGSGKTTISEVLRKSDKFPNSKVSKTDSESDIFVYNRKFVEENFRQNENIKGIFTLGQDQKEIMDDIENKKTEIEKHIDKIAELNPPLDDKKSEMETIKNEFQEECWKLKNKYSSYFKEAFKGYGNSKEKLMKKFIEEADNSRDIKNLDDLMQRRESLFESPLSEIVPFKKIHVNLQFDNSELLDTKIIGAQDVDIADLITQLNISDWVLQGHKHMKSTNGVCPFCQQSLPDELDEKLHTYFDQTYSDQINRLTSFSESYKTSLNTIMEKLRELQNTGNAYLDMEKVRDHIQILEAKKRDNFNLIDQKLKEPSSTVSLQDIADNLHEINNEIQRANEQIKKYNALVANSDEAKKELLKDIWGFLCEQNKDNYKHFNKEYDSLNKEIKGRAKNIDTKKEHKKKLEGELLQLQKKVTNIEHSVNEINKMLNSLGFTNFKLATADEDGHYKIIRENGEDVEDTLSEGEKTFITFLYFYNLLKGSNDRENISAKKLVVLDDPISSLDSNVLFIVSNLTRQLIEEIKSNSSDIKQLILLTHNIYFHKEVSFKKGNQASNDETFWIIRKSNNRSSIQQYDENPIRSSYELLWNELKLLKEQSLITTQNVMRRILENYFSFFGGIDLTEIVEKFEGEEKVACRSLLTWVHDGSHYINEDLFVERSIDITERYFNIFKQIFYRMGHSSHFDMMMKGFNYDISIQANENNAEQQDRASESQIAASIEVDED